MKDRVDPTTRSAAMAPSRQQHQIPLDDIDRDVQREKCLLSPLSPTLSEASSASSSSPVPSSRKYARKEKIGQGAQGSVYRCIEVATGNVLAVKIIMTHELSPVELEAIKREVKTIKKLHHEHLVSYYKATERKSRQLSIYMEFVAGGSLSARLRQGGALALAVTKAYTRQLCEALRYLHENRLAHRDIKCANVFLTSAGDSIKLGDFGAFKEVGSVSLVGGLKGTPHWMAPEVIRAEQQTSEDGWFKADIWSLGCTVIEMLTGHSPWQQYSNPLTAMYQIVSSNKTPTIPEGATEETASFLALCLQRNPDERASIQELLKHPFVSDIGNHDDRSVGMPTHGPEMASTPSKSDIEDQSANQPESVTPKLKASRSHRDIRKEEAPEQPEQHPHEVSPVKAEAKRPTPQALASPRHTPAPPSATRPSIRKPSIIPRLKPLELIHSPSNQDKESHHHHHEPSPLVAKPPAMARGVSVGALGVDAGKASPAGTPIRSVRLRRLSTAPAPSRETEEILGCVPSTHKLKLPPLSARPASSATGSSSMERL